MATIPLVTADGDPIYTSDGFPILVQSSVGIGCVAPLSTGGVPAAVPPSAATAVQVAVVTFRVQSGTGLQTIPGVVDRNGVPFEGKLFLFHSGSTVLNTLWSNGVGLFNSIAADQGLYIAATDEGWYNAIADVPQFGAKIASGGGAGGTPAYPVCSLEADAFFGGNIYRVGQVTNIVPGSFDVRITANLNFFPTDMMVTVIGGDNLELDFSTVYTNTGTHLTPFQAIGLLTAQGLYNAGNPATGAGGGGGQGWGWDTPNGGPGAAHVLIGNSAQPNWRIQRTDCCDVSIADVAGVKVPSGFPTIISWDPASITAAGKVGTGGPAILFGGASLVMASGAFLQPPAPSIQRVDLGIDAYWVMLLSYGAPPDGNVLDVAELCTGWTDGRAQTCYYFGESATNQPLMGTGFLSNTDLLRFPLTGPIGAPTTFTAIARLSALRPTGTMDLNWTVVDGVGRQILWVALGMAASGSTPSGSGAGCVLPVGVVAR